MSEGDLPCPMTLNGKNVPVLRGEKHDIYLKILIQAGFETARQAAILTKLHALTIAPRPSYFVSGKILYEPFYITHDRSG